VNDSINEANEDLPANPTLMALPISKEPESLSGTDNQSSSPAYFNNAETPRDLVTNFTSDTSTSSASIQSSSRTDINNSETRCELAADSTTHASTSFSVSGEECTTPELVADSTIHTSTSFSVSGEDCTTKSHTSPASPVAIAESLDTEVAMQDAASPTSGEVCTTKSHTSPASPVTITESLDSDVAMQDTASPTSATQNDENLPTWLRQMMVYLRGVSEAPAWHDLVSGFVEFEKCGPPHGVSSCLLLFGTD
jgi:hypothetical protein